MLTFEYTHHKVIRRKDGSELFTKRKKLTGQDVSLQAFRSMLQQANTGLAKGYDEFFFESDEQKKRNEQVT